MNMFSEKVVIITGASSGIGAALAIGFAKEQAMVCITGRNVQNLKNTAEKCVETGGEKPLMMVGDVVNKAHLEDIVDVTVKTYGRIDVLVNNAAYVRPALLEKTTVDDYDITFDTNVKAVIFLSQLAMPYLVKTKGSIINISSLAGLKSYAGTLMYSMSKAALDQFTKCTALELAPKGVRVNSVNLGYFRTNLTSTISFITSEETLQKFEESYRQLVPLGRNGQLEDVVEIVLFLASNRSSFITGHLLPLDGGRGLVTPRPTFV